MKNIFVLVVDDDEDDTEIFVEAIRSLDGNIEIQTSNNALTALKDLRQSERVPDYIFLDMEMPYMNGSEFLDAIANEKLLQSVTTYIYTSHSASFLEHLAKENKNFNYITKPNNFKSLVTTLSDILLTND